ncbi:hypothetical protein ACH5RR_013144 [Cinchona calisaya]|uniref:Uncharacterized protein n=1 Tax=Cinchona calisaya TaxID=153742 RepID=A0ABD2ZZB1_9GENT
MVANALLRRSTMIADYKVITQVVPSWIEEVMDSYKGDEHAQNLIREKILQPTMEANWSYQNETKVKGKNLCGKLAGGEEKSGHCIPLNSEDIQVYKQVT